MKVLESRHLTTDVILMTWSPKMDILAIANTKPEVILHRLTWQKVWTLGNNFGRRGEQREPNPICLTFHPEGLYLAIGFADCVILVEVESGNIITKHHVSDLSTVQWKSTNYGYSLKDVFSAESEKLESNLSILLLGTKYGNIHIYSGAGLLFTVTLRLNSPYPCHVLDIEIPSDFSSVQVVTSNRCETNFGNVLSLYYFDCSEYAFHADVLGVFAAKAISYKRYLSAIDVELTGVHENWSKIVDVYTHYLSYGTGKTSDTITADYAELLMTGVCSAELEMFLGNVGREKEAKKLLNALQSAHGGFLDSVKNIKCNIIYLLRELADITGYFSYAQINSESNIPSMGGGDPATGVGIIRNLKQLLSVLYHGALHAQHTSGVFIRSLVHFITLVINTAHGLNGTESSEMVDEDPEPQKVFELLEFKVNRNIFEMLEINPEDPELDPKTCVPEAVRIPTEESAENKLSFLDEVIPSMTAEELENFYKVPSIIDIDELCGEIPGVGSSSPWPSLWKFFKDKEIPMKPQLVNHPNAQLNRMLMSFLQMAEEQLQALLTVPLLDSQVPKSNFVLNCFETGNLENDKCGIIMDQSSQTTFVFHKDGSAEGGNRVWLYQVDNLTTSDFATKDDPDGPTNPIVTAALLSFTQMVSAANFFDSNILSVLCYAPQVQPTTRRRPSHLEEDEEYEPMEIPGNSVICHIYIRDILEGLPSRALRIPTSTTVLANKWTDIDITVPSDVTVPGPIEHEHIVHVLPIGSFHPTMMALSGARRVGAILDTSKKIIQLLDMDLESSDNSIDQDTTTGSTASTVTEEVNELTLE